MPFSASPDYDIRGRSVFSLHKSCPHAKVLEGEFQRYVCSMNVYGYQLPAGD